MDKPIIFFDGVCSLCNGYVDFIFRHDKDENLLVASLQGETAKDKLDPKLVNDLNTIVLLDGKKVYTKSSAVLKSLSFMGLPWSLMGIFFIIPKMIRDFIYNQVSKNRYKMFGKRETCRLPTQSENERFLK